VAKTGIKNVNYNLLDSGNQSDLGVPYDYAPILVVFGAVGFSCKDIEHPTPTVSQTYLPGNNAIIYR
jgi:hypothetical protein